MIVSLPALAFAQQDDPISPGSFRFERSGECVPVKRQSGDVFSGPRGYLVEKREIQARGDGDRIWVEERFVLRNRGKSCPTERCADARCGQVQVRLPLPPRAGFGRACIREEGDKACVEVEYHRDSQAAHIVVLNLPMLQPDSSSAVSTNYVVPAVPLYGARSWLSATLPPRGLDARAVDKVALVAEDGKQNQVRDTGLAVDLQVSTSGKDQPLLSKGRRTVVVIDRSPSMDGPAEGRVAPLLAGLLDTASPDRLVRFGYLRGGLIIEPGFVPVQALGSLRSLMHPADPSDAWLRATTETAALSELFDSGIRRGDQVLLVSDGALHLSPQSRTFFRQAAQRGVAVHILNLDLHTVDPKLERWVETTGGDVREIGLRWNLVPRHLLDGYVRGALYRPPATSQKVARRGGWKGAALADLAAQVRALQQPTKSLGVPAESALRILREQLVPAARLCLRKERRGRTGHSRRATFEFELTRQEIEGLRVKGKLPSELHRCLYEAAAKLTVPRFEGRVRVRYPIYTEALKVPPTVELRSETRALLDDLMGAP